MLLRIRGLLAATTLAAVHSSSAQAPTARMPVAQRAPVSVRGVAFDSLRGEPLRNAFVAVVGGPPNTVTDTLGRFHFDSVVPGTYSFAMQHPLLDSLGFPGLSTRVTVVDGRDEVRIAIPSFATLWSTACGSATVPKEAGFVYGSVRDAASGAPVANATVTVAWTEVLFEKASGVTQRHWNLDSRSDSAGGYALCGVPVWASRLRMQASADTSSSGQINLPYADTRVQRRDLTVGPTVATDSTRLGSIVGMLTDALGEPFFGARVLMDEAPETRTGMDGRFVIRNVPPGTRQLELLSVGMDPIQTEVEVRGGDTALVVMQLGRAQTLEAVHVEADARRRTTAHEFELRRRSGQGIVLDSTAIMKYQQFATILGNIPTLRLQNKGTHLTLTMPDGHGRTCLPAVRIDGVVASFNNLVDLYPREVAALEVYPRVSTLPTGFTQHIDEPACGMIMVWTKYAFRVR
jgi:hypothetical protein